MYGYCWDRKWSAQVSKNLKISLGNRKLRITFRCPGTWYALLLQNQVVPTFSTASFLCILLVADLVFHQDLIFLSLGCKEKAFVFYDSQVQPSNQLLFSCLAKPKSFSEESKHLKPIPAISKNFC